MEIEGDGGGVAVMRVEGDINREEGFLIKLKKEIII